MGLRITFLLLAVGVLPAASKAYDAPPARNLRDAGGWVTGLAFSPDGQTLATSGGETLLYRPGDTTLWNLADGAERLKLVGQPACVWDVAYSPDGTQLATAGYDKTARLWDAATGALRHTLAGHKNWVIALAFAPDGKQLATASEDGTVKLWDTTTGAEVATLAGHDAMIRGLAYSPDGQTLATASWDKTVRLWSVPDRAERRKFDGLGDAAWTVAFSPDGRLLAAAGADRTIRIWVVASGEQQATWSAHNDWITSLAFSPDGKLLASGGFDRTARLWDASTGQQLAELGPWKGTVWTVGFSPEGARIAAGGQGAPAVRVWDVATKAELFAPPAAAAAPAEPAAEPMPAPNASAPTAAPPAAAEAKPAEPAPESSAAALDPEALARSATIHRDAYGVPHIEGPTDASVVFAFAYAQAEDYFWQVEDTYLMCTGQYAEVVGMRGLQNDLLNRAFEVVPTSKQTYASLTPHERGLCDAFAAGLNYYLAKHPETKPRLITHFEPWMVLAFSRHLTLEMSFGHTGQAKQYFPEGHDALWKAVGSNAWAVAPQRSKNKTALLVANPHQPWFGFGQFYEGHLKSGEGWNFSGATFFGSPLPTIGHNERLGWTFTVNEPDIADAWIETFDDPQRPLAYRYGEGYREATEWRETVRLKRGRNVEPREYTFRKTHHGPVIAKRGENQAISVQVAKLYEAVLMRQLSRLLRAQNFTEFRAGMAMQNFPFMNTVYADADGNIFYLYNGTVPRRDPQFDWRSLQDGADPRTEWDGYLTIDELPQVLNPPSGYVQSCNSSPYTTTDDGNPSIGDFPKYLAEDAHDDKRRAVRSRQFLRELTEATFETMEQAVFDTEIYWARQELPKFAREFEALKTRNPELAAKVDPLLRHLLDWDCRVTEDSTQATLLIQWYEELYGFGYPAETIKAEFIAQPDERFAALVRAAEKLKGVFGKWEKPWGEVNRIQRHADVADFYEIPFADKLPSLPCVGAQGPPGTMFTMYYTPSVSIPLVRVMKKHYGVVGLSYCAVMEFGPQVKAKSLLQFGQSGDPKSPHYFDQAELLSRRQMKPELFHWDDVLAGAKRSYHPGEEIAPAVVGGGQ